MGLVGVEGYDQHSVSISVNIRPNIRLNAVGVMVMHGTGPTLGLSLGFK